jgi:hypothetical protein
LFPLIGLLAFGGALPSAQSLDLPNHSPATLQPQRVLQVRGGDAVFFGLHLDGKPIYRAQIIVRRNAQGELLFTRHAGLPASYHRLGDWRISDDQAWQAARAEAPPVRYLNEDEARTHGSISKAWLGQSGGLRPVFVVRQASPVPLWSLETLVDASSGVVLSTVNRVLHLNRAQVFDYDPGVERDMNATTEVVLDPTPSTRLRSDVFDIGNCCVTERCREGAEPKRIDVNFGQINASLPICDELAMASPDENGDWLFEPSQFNLSGINTFAMPIRAQIDDPHAPHRDSFAEVQGYHHTHAFMSHLRAHGLQAFAFDNQTERSMPLRVTVNYLMPSIPFGGQAEIGTLSAMGCMGPLTQQPVRIDCFYPFDNAAFIPAVGQGTGNVDLPLERSFDSVLMFQGIKSKFVYAADVLYHELIHAVIGSTSNLNGGYLDDYGAHLTPGALNEGFADYGALTLTEIPTLGRYVGSADQGAIRELGEAKACPTDLTGEVHDDGIPWASSLWAFRQQLEGDTKDNFDTAVFTAMTTMAGRNAGYTDAALAVVEEAALLLGSDLEATLRQHFLDQGLIDCERTVAINPTNAEIPDEPLIEALHLSSADNFGLQRGELIPAPYQIKIHLPAGTRSAQLSWSSSAGGTAGIPGMGGEGDEGEVLGVIKLRERIVFSYESGVVSHDGQRTLETARRGSSERLPMMDLDLSCGETLFVSLGTTGAAKVLRDIELQAVIDDDLAAECDPPPTGVPPVDPVPAEGCGCSGDLASTWLWLLPMIGLRRRRG